MRLAVLIICLITLTTYNKKRFVEPEAEILQAKIIVTKDTIVNDPPAAAIFPAFKGERGILFYSFHIGKSKWGYHLVAE